MTNNLVKENMENSKERKVIVTYGTKPLKDIMKEILIIKTRNT